MRRLFLFRILALTLTLLAFQNCAENPSGQDRQPFSPSEKVIGPTANFNRIAFDPNLEFAIVPGVRRLDIDISTDSMTLSDKTVGSKSCPIDSSRALALESIITNSHICEPGPLPDGMSVCMAIGIADIKLANSSESILLRPLICQSGTWLCGDKDIQLRQLLVDLRDNPPLGCL